MSEDERSDAQPDAAKRPYVTPELTRLGLLRELTRYTF